MANRNFNRVQALEKEVKHMYLDVAIGAAGAPTMSRALGAASIVRNSAGDYTITMQDKFNRLMAFGAMQLVSAAQDIQFEAVSESVNSGKTVRFRCLTGAVATDPSSGSRLLIRLDLKNSSV